MIYSLQKMEPTPTADLDRNNDRVYDSTICVVRAITELTHGVQGTGKLDFLDLVRKVGLELRVLLGSVDDLVAFFPDAAKHEVGRLSSTSNLLQRNFEVFRTVQSGSGPCNCRVTQNMEMVTYIRSSFNILSITCRWKWLIKF
jgi:hypothetical protein